MNHNRHIGIKFHDVEYKRESQNPPGNNKVVQSEQELTTWTQFASHQ